MLQVHLWHWLAFGALVVVLLVLDLVVFHRRIHTPTLRESALWSVFWVSLALIFNAFVWWWGYQTHGDSEAGLKFLTGFLVEKSLSMDNLFVFAVIFRYFRVELKYQYRVLFWGVLGAILMRLVFILAGVGLLHFFDWALLIFGAFLLYTGIRLAMTHGADVHPEHNLILRTARRLLPVTHGFREQHFFAHENGRLCITPLLLVLLVVESSDVLFAVDSVPAIIGITKDPFIVFTSNIFAILGLRALYFLLAGVMDRFRYLHYGLAAILVFIGLKMCAEYLAEKWLGKGTHLVPAWASLIVIASLLSFSVIVSVLATRRENRRAALAQEETEAESENNVLEPR
ncbi:MAG: TerC family protein [Pirellulales bacterium]|nr:TerC family protein [Pirellulales bacterium]